MLHLLLCIFTFSVATPPLQIACVGDSITYALPQTPYPSILQNIGCHVNVTNFGVPGATMMKNGDYPYWNTPQFQNALHSNPNVVLIMLGTNDAKVFQWNQTQFVTDYNSMISIFKHLSSRPSVYISIPVPIKHDAPYPWNTSVINTIFPGNCSTNHCAGLIPTIAHSNNVTYIDQFNALGGANFSCLQCYYDTTQSTCGCDGIHPDNYGFTRMAQLVSQTLKLKFPQNFH